MLFTAIFFSPIIMVLVAVVAVSHIKESTTPSPSIKRLLSLSFVYAAVGAIGSLALLIAWMVWYEKSTGYSAGNAPLGWIFFYGPLSVALGQLAALIHWWPKNRAKTIEHETPSA